MVQFKDITEEIISPAATLLLKAQGLDTAQIPTHLLANLLAYMEEVQQKTTLAQKLEDDNTALRQELRTMELNCGVKFRSFPKLPNGESLDTVTFQHLLTNAQRFNS